MTISRPTNHISETTFAKETSKQTNLKQKNNKQIFLRKRSKFNFRKEKFDKSQTTGPRHNRLRPCPNRRGPDRRVLGFQIMGYPNRPGQMVSIQRQQVQNQECIQCQDKGRQETHRRVQGQTQQICQEMGARLPPGPQRPAFRFQRRS